MKNFVSYKYILGICLLLCIYQNKRNNKKNRNWFKWPQPTTNVVCTFFCHIFFCGSNFCVLFYLRLFQKKIIQKKKMKKNKGHREKIQKRNIYLTETTWNVYIIFPIYISNLIPTFLFYNVMHVFDVLWRSFQTI